MRFRAHNGHMGMFTQKPEEPSEWAGLPSEPWDRDEATDLLAPLATDPLGVGLGLGPGVSVSIQVPPPTP